MDEKVQNRLIDMRNYAQDAIELLGDLSEDEFLADKRTRYAVIRALEVIGEAAAQTGRSTLAEFAHDIVWKEIIGMRNVLIHQYSGIEDRNVYKTVKQSLPEFLDKLNKLLDDKT